MTLNDIQRAQLALFAARAAGEGASLEQMKAICYCIRNRVRQGWHDGEWLTVMEQAGDVAGNLPGAHVYLSLENRALQRLVADVDDIYYGARERMRATPAAPTAQSFEGEPDSLEESLDKACYWVFVNQPIAPWFQENVLDRPQEHPMRAQMGMMLFLE